MRVDMRAASAQASPPNHSLALRVCACAHVCVSACARVRVCTCARACACVRVRVHAHACACACACGVRDLRPVQRLWHQLNLADVALHPPHPCRRAVDAEVDHDPLRVASKARVRVFVRACDCVRV